jgi:hypothetical protein
LKGWPARLLSSRKRPRCALASCANTNGVSKRLSRCPVMPRHDRNEAQNILTSPPSLFQPEAKCRTPRGIPTTLPCRPLQHGVQASHRPRSLRVKEQRLACRAPKEPACLPRTLLHARALRSLSSAIKWLRPCMRTSASHLATLAHRGSAESATKTRAGMHEARSRASRQFDVAHAQNPAPSQRKPAPTHASSHVAP